VHPASARILQLWSGHYARLGLHDPGLTEQQPPAMTLDEVIDRLCAADFGLDLREHGGPVYLDATRYGMPLRQIVAGDGRPNYLACALRELVPMAGGYDEIVLLYDRELEADYVMLDRVLTRSGATVRRVGIGRVPINGEILSARHGGWRHHSTGELLNAMYSRHSEAAVRLGMRLYFIAMLGPGAEESFRRDLLDRWLRRAERLLSVHIGSGIADPAALLAKHRGEHCYVDPYRLTSSLLARRAPQPTDELLAAVFT
jgi:hypothetical protein